MMHCRSPSASPVHGSDQPFSLPNVDPLEVTSSCKAVEPIDANNLKIYQTLFQITRISQLVKIFRPKNGQVRPVLDVEFSSILIYLI